MNCRLLFILTVLLPSLSGCIIGPHTGSRANAGDQHQSILPNKINLSAQEKKSDAVVLFDRTEIQRLGDRNQKTYVHRALYIHTIDGLDYGEVVLPYNPAREHLRITTAQTILPDGSIVPVEKFIRKEVVGRGRHNSLMSITFVFPKVVPGSVIEYGFTSAENMGSSTGRAFFSWNIPVREVDYVFSGVNTSRLETRFHGLEKKVSGRRVRFAADNLLPKEDEYFQPSFWDTDPWLSYVYYPSDYFMSDNRFWLAYTSHFASTALRLKRRVPKKFRDDIENPSMEDLRRLWLFVQDNMAQRSSLSWLDRRDTADAMLASGYGNQNERALVIASILWRWGADVHLLYVSPFGEQSLEEGFQTTEPLQNLVVRTQVEGRDVYLDPSCLGCDVGELSEKHQGRDALELNIKNMVGRYGRGNDNQVHLVYLPKPDDGEALPHFFAELGLSERGLVAQSGKYTLHGQAAASLRYHFFNHPMTKEKREKEMRERYLDGMETGKISAEGIDELSGPVKITMTDVLWKRQGFVHTDDWTYIPLTALVENFHLQRIKKDRKTPVAFDERPRSSYEIRMNLPNGRYLFLSPKAMTFSNDAGIYAMKVLRENNQLVFKETLELKYKDYAGARLTKLLELVTKINEAKSQQVILRAKM